MTDLDNTHQRGYNLAKGIYLRQANEARAAQADMEARALAAEAALARVRALLPSSPCVSPLCPCQKIDADELRAALDGPNSSLCANLPASRPDQAPEPTQDAHKPQEDPQP